MKSLIFFVVSVLVSANVAAQNSTISFFTEDGQRFYVVLNGEKQNDQPLTKVNVADVKPVASKLKIIMEEDFLGAISKDLTIKPNSEYVFLVKPDEATKNKYQLKLVSSTALTSQNNPANNNAIQQNAANTSGTRQSVRTQRKNMFMNVQIQKAGTSGNFRQANSKTAIDEKYKGPTNCSLPMSKPDFATAKRSIASKSFEDSKLSAARQLIHSNCLLSSQVIAIMQLFDLEDTKLGLAKYAYAYTYDLGNYYEVNDAFEYESSIDDLNKYIHSK